MTGPKRLRFDCEMKDGESIVGAVYRGASRHVLASTFPVLREAGVSRKSINFMQLLPAHEIAAVADIIKCDPQQLGRYAGVRQGNAAPDERGRQRIAFGSLVLEGCHLDHRARRFSAASLKLSPHHRTDWLNRLLPYCPFSFELLSDTCPSCSQKLRWTRPLGIEFCEHCEFDLRNSVLPRLDRSLRRDYRSFADLCSIEENRREAIVDSLPHQVRKTPPGTLVRASLHIGQFVAGRDPVPETHLSKLPAPELANIVTTGMRALAQWPAPFQAWITKEANARQSDKRRYSAFRRSVRVFARQLEKEPGGKQLIKKVIPEFAKGSAANPAVIRTHFSMAAAKRHLRTDYDRLMALCERGLIENSSFQREDGSVSRRLLDAERVNKISDDLDRVVHHWEFWKAFRLPSYAIEQLICLGVIEGVSDRAIVALRNEVMIPREEVARMAQKLKRRAQKSSRPASVKSLRVLSHEIGGRLKPWGFIWKALIDGELPFWTRAASYSTQHILVEPASWNEFIAEDFDRTGYPHFPFKNFMNNCDLSETLNLQPEETIAIRQGKLITPRAYKLTLRYAVDDVLALAAKYVSVTEMMRRSGRTKRFVLQLLQAHAVESRTCLWERSAAEAVVLGRARAGSLLGKDHF